LTLGSLLALMAVSVLHQAFTLSRGIKQGLQFSSRLDQALLQFRRDAWRADRAQLEDSRLVFLYKDSEKVTYRVTENRLHRLAEPQPMESDYNAEITDRNALVQTKSFPIAQPSHRSRRIEFELDEQLVRLNVILEPERVSGSSADDPAPTQTPNRRKLERSVFCELGKWSTRRIETDEGAPR
ncbi:MAG: hypothetical protein AAGG44_06240, partial [Planctomycetota bacterium]